MKFPEGMLKGLGVSCTAVKFPGNTVRMGYGDFPVM